MGVMTTVPFKKSGAYDTTFTITAPTNVTFPTSGTLATTGGSITTASNLAGGSGGTIPYQSAAGTTAMLANGTANQVLMANGTTVAPSWTSTITNITLVNPALGTPASGTMTNVSGTAASLTAGLAQGLTGTPNITVGTIGSGAITSTGILSTSDTTDATSTTAASLKTAGGLAVLLKSYFGGSSYWGTGRVSVGAATTGITTATTIHTQSNTSNAIVLIVQGNDGPNYFLDLISYTGGGPAPIVLASSNIYGSPTVRTYSGVGLAIKLAMASGTYSTTVMPFEL